MFRTYRKAVRRLNSSINYEKRLQGLINANDTLNPCLSLCSALMNTFTTYKQAIVIFRNITLTILTESNGSFYTFDPHARNHDGMPNSNGTATVLKFGDLGEPRPFLCSLPNELKCEYFLH